MIKPIDNKYRAWIRKQPCAKCGNPWNVEAAHMRILGHGGMGLKPHDKDLLPLCSDLFNIGCHQLEHKGAVTFWGQGTKAKTKEYVRQLCNNYIRRYENEMQSL